jgi:hypothetical protein
MLAAIAIEQNQIHPAIRNRTQYGMWIIRNQHRVSLLSEHGGSAGQTISVIVNTENGSHWFASAGR